MIKLLSGLALTFSILFVSVSETKAQSKAQPLSESLEKQKSEARIFITRTARVVLDVQVQVAKGNVLQGDFSAAVNHTRHAIELYQSGSYRRAAMHAELARRLALKASKANQGKIDASLSSLNEQEKSIMQGPRQEDAELITEVAKLLKSKPAVSEAGLVKSELIDLKQANLNTVLK
jgi:hypothetical protein